MNSSTSISKRWLIIYAVTLLAAIALGWAYAVWFEPETKFWRKAFIERRAQFEEPVEERRVIFTGDSACAFGINPSVFKEETGLLSANLGGTRQMGMRVFMDEALSQTREGDAIVLICNPYLLVAEAAHGSHPNAGARMALALSADLTAREFVDATRPGFNHLVSLGGKIALGMPMFRYGDKDRIDGGQVVTAGRDRAPASVELFEIQEDFAKLESVLRALQSRCEEEGVTLCYLPPLQLTDDSVLSENRERKGAFLGELSQRVPAVKVIQMTENGCSNEEEIFADTLYHLTQKGAEAFTRKIAPLVKEAIRVQEKP